MTDLRAEATRIGYWNEGVGAWHWEVDSEASDE